MRLGLQGDSVRGLDKTAALKIGRALGFGAKEGVRAMPWRGSYLNFSAQGPRESTGLRMVRPAKRPCFGHLKQGCGELGRDVCSLR